MEMIATIFDIDGTLVDSYDFDGQLFKDAIKKVLGEVSIRDDWSEYEHATDSGILEAIMRANDITATESLADVKADFEARIDRYLLNGGTCNPIAGAVEFLDELHVRGECVIGYATGCWEASARSKLHYAGFNRDFVLSSSDDSSIRTEIMENCLNKLGDGFDKIFYFGDAVWDLKATSALGWDFIGIGPRLKGICPHWFNDFTLSSEIMGILKAWTIQS